MSEPRRLKDDPGMEAMLLRSADDDAPAEGTRRALALAIGLAPLPLPPPPAAPPPVAPVGAAAAVGAKAGLGILAKTVIGVAVATGVGVGVKTVVQQPTISTKAIAQTWQAAPPPAPPSPPPAVAVVVPPPPIEAPPPPVEAPPPAIVHKSPPPSARIEPAPAPAAVPAPPPAPPAPEVVTPPAPHATLTDEVTLIDGALAALRHRDPMHALALLDDYDSRYPTGAMAPEAAVARIQATLAKGDAAKARELGEQFLAAHPRSPLAGRVRDLISHAP